MAKKIFISLVLAATITMSILSCIFRWFIPGYILVALGVGLLSVYTYLFCAKNGKLGLVAPAVVVFFTVVVWLPLAMVGFEIGALESLIILGTLSASAALPLVWTK